MPGRELTVAVLGDRALCVTEIITNGWYDYHAKYAPGGSRHVLPGGDTRREITEACLDYALRAHRGAGLPRPQPHRFPLGRQRAALPGCSFWKPTPSRA